MLGELQLSLFLYISFCENEPSFTSFAEKERTFSVRTICNGANLCLLPLTGCTVLLSRGLHAACEES